MMQVIAFLYVFWLLFVASMNFYRAELNKKMTTSIRILAAPVILTAYVVDATANIFIASVVFLELPREWLVTSRLRRYMKDNTDWRKACAVWLCSNLLDPLDPTGNHCQS